MSLEATMRIYEVDLDLEGPDISLKGGPRRPRLPDPPLSVIGQHLEKAILISIPPPKFRDRKSTSTIE